MQHGRILGNLQQLLAYLKGTIDMSRVIGKNGLEILQTWVDASYAINQGMKGHTGGGVMTMGRGVINNKCSKQKLNTRSSTETELVGASDYITWIVWAKQFLYHQGYNFKRIIYYQDNESAIKIDKNGRKSCG